MTEAILDPAPGPLKPEDRKDPQGNRLGLLEHVTALAGGLMVVLAFVWLGLVILDSTRGFGPALPSLSTVIWVLFGLGFAVKLIIAPREEEFLRRK